MKKSNDYARQLNEIYDKTPKAVFAAVVVSLLTSGGDYPERALGGFLEEWRVLYINGIIPQKPPSE